MLPSPVNEQQSTNLPQIQNNMAKAHSQTALLLVDIQQGFDHPTYWGSARSTPSFESNVSRLLSAFRKAPGAQIIHVRHHSIPHGSPLHPSCSGAAFQPYAVPLPNEVVLSKTVNSAFIGTDLEKILREREITKLVVCGLTTDHCVSTTVRMAGNLRVLDYPAQDGDYEVSTPGEVILVGDATATFGKEEFDGELVHAVHLASLNREFCNVSTTEEILKGLDHV